MPWIISIFIVISVACTAYKMQNEKMKKLKEELDLKRIQLNRLAQSYIDVCDEYRVLNVDKPVKIGKKEIGNLMNSICRYMERDKPYRDPEFSMSKLCTALAVNRTYVSSTINGVTGLRFETFVNSYRIAEAIDLLASDNSYQYTLEYFARKVGFKSKSTFNRSFKYFTQTNPSYFQKHIQPDSVACNFFINLFHTKLKELYKGDHLDFDIIIQNNGDVQSEIQNNGE